MKGNCANCALLDKTRRREVDGCFQYGCNSNKRYDLSKNSGGWIPCWIESEDLLWDLQPGSCWMPIVENPKQISIYDLLG